MTARLCLRLILVFVQGILTFQAGAQELEKVVAFGGAEQDRPTGMALDPAGNVYLCSSAYTEGVMHFGGFTLTNGTRHRIFLSKHLPDGKVDWVGTFNASLMVKPAGIAVDPRGYIYLAGIFVGQASWSSTITNEFIPLGLESVGDLDVFLIKCDFAGNLIWAKRFGQSNSEECQSVAVDQTGNILIGGQYGILGDTRTQIGSIELQGEGVGHFWLAKLDEDGTPLWARAAHSPTWPGGGTRIVSDSKGDIYFSSQYRLGLTMEGAELPAGEDWNNFLAKYDPSGKLLWIKRNEVSILSSLVVDSADALYVTGSLLIASVFDIPRGRIGDIELTNSDSSFLAKIAPDGNAVWAQTGGAEGLSIGPDGHLYGTGSFGPNRRFGDVQLRAAGMVDAFALKWNKEGKILWVKSISDVEQDYGNYIAVSKEGTIYVAGNSYHDKTKSFFNYTSYGSSDIILASFVDRGPRIIQQPEEQVMTQGTNVLFSVVLTNAISPAYQWLKNGVQLVESDRITGVASEQLRIINVQLDDQGEYLVRVTTSEGSLFSKSVRLRLHDLLHFISAEKSPHGEFVVTFTGEIGRVYEIEYSTNLVNWFFLTNGFLQGGTLSIGDRSANSSPGRFYRALSR